MKFPAIAVCSMLVLSGCVTGRMLNFAPSSPSGSASQTVEAPLGGIVGGGLIMGELGGDLSRRERRSAVEAEYRALESTPAGEPIAWSDERSGHRGTVTAAQPYRVGSQDCRSYTHRVEAQGGVRTAHGTACRNPDGSWTLLN